MRIVALLDRRCAILYNAGVSNPSKSSRAAHLHVDRVWGLALALVTLGLAVYALFFWQPRGLLITWSTGNEFDIIGFNLYRADTADGEYVKINPQMIQGSADNAIGGDYRYLDTGVTKGRAYYYKLERIHRLGRPLPLEGPIELHTPRFPIP